MNTKPVLSLVLCAALAACTTPSGDSSDIQEHRGPWAGDEIQNASLYNAIISQHTLYPYHFLNGSGELNELGARDLSVLTDHFLHSGGDLNVHRGAANETVYEARVKTVLERLSAAGVPAGAVAVKDGLPGGDGISSERVIVILKEKMSKSDNGMTGSMNSGSNGASSGTSLK
jgi:predicted small secreted protein